MSTTSPSPHSTERFAFAMQSALTRSEVVDAYLTHARTVIPASAVGLYRLDEQSRRVLDVHAVTSDQFLDAYEAYGRNDDPVLSRVMEERTPLDSSRLPGNQWDRSGARQALAVARYAHSLLAPVMSGTMFFGTINFARGTSQEPFSHADLSGAQRIAEHVGRAMERALRFEATAQRTALIENAFDHLDYPVIITDLGGRVLFFNRAARREWPVPLGPDGSLPIADGLARAIMDATERFAHDGKKVVSRTVSMAGGKSVVAKTVRLAGGTPAAATVLFEHSGRQSEGRLPDWQVLSNREKDIARLVSEGLTTKQIAERAFVSENTVKQHLKRIYAKTDVTNRAGLIQLIWASTHGPEGR
ncbi:LuxR C-terminal-related transcriptional regulator [Streptomyces sp. NPDC093109]|uniref:LuxR C-terminal-related transcriptional regulator n=1 Tax=Streptomyces sp. NPDC093109 TaxID=3154977 RepID=UPI00344CC3E0